MSFANLPNMFTKFMLKRRTPKDTKPPITLEQSITNHAWEIFPDDPEAKEQTIDVSVTASPSSSALSLSLNSSDEAIPLLSLLLRVTGVQEEVLFKQHGYNKIVKLDDILQGELILAENMSSNDDDNNLVLIKKCDKDLVSGNVTFADDEDMHFCIDDNIFKERDILQYLTIDNNINPSCDYICKYLNFFESDTNYYLVTQYVTTTECAATTLNDFILKCHKYIQNGKLKRKHFEKAIKYLFWQLSATIYWLHNDMHCCHLNLSMESILIENGNFIKNGNGEYIIDPSIIIKLTDFSQSEVFKPNDFNFRCMKYSNNMTIDNVQYLCPNLYNERIYDARKQDMWSLGMILFNCIIGKPIYNEINYAEVNQPIIGSGYWAVSTSQIDTYLNLNNIKYINSKIISIIINLLQIDENKRMNSIILLKHSWFKSYFKKYQTRIQKKSIKQAQQLQSQRQQLNSFPFYMCPFH